MRQAPPELLDLFKVRSYSTCVNYPFATVAILNPFGNSRSWVCDYSQSNRDRHGTYRQHPVQRGQSEIPLRHGTTSHHNPEDTVNPVAALDKSWVTRVDFPAVFFIDPLVFQHCQVQVPPANPISPSFPLCYLGTEAEIKKYVSSFFNGVHKWLSFISEERLSTYLAKPLSEYRADLACLLLCIRMILWVPSSQSKDPRTDIYLAAKQGISNMETSNILSIQTLQAGLLISLYEVGHAMYPSAYLSVGTCARYGYALGLGAKNSIQICRPFTREEVEERRRVLWAIIVLDR